ncbi:MAG TPA: GntR family transcriptional regulator [Streptosporangiaceae bacterium]|nr:GntR family transcriptional regulator [Streptosporangiaceae bacterium]
MPDPMYRQIAEDLRQKIESGELGHGDQLPTELELRERYEASRNTVRDAVKWLITRGLVETRPGQGTFVVEKIDPFITTLTAELETGLGGEDTAYASEVAARQRRPTVTAPRIEILRASELIASELRLDAGSTIVSRGQRRYIDDTPWSLQITFYPMRLVEQGAVRLIQAQDMPAGTVRYLEEVLGIRQVGCRDKITVRAPDANETAFFKLPDDGRVAVFEIFQTGFDEQGTPIRLTVSVYPADRNQFAVDIGRVPDLAPVPAFG